MMQRREFEPPRSRPFERGGGGGWGGGGGSKDHVPSTKTECDYLYSCTKKNVTKTKISSRVVKKNRRFWERGGGGGGEEIKEARNLVFYEYTTQKGARVKFLAS